ncbi:MAG: hypothetical protein KF782_34025 [Labilithrix sp.]|nr:hypothetical protein [Labilithrix sp.]
MKRSSSPRRAPSLGGARLLLGASVLAVACTQGACDTQGFASPRGGTRLAVELVGADDPDVVGTRLRPLALSIDQPQPFRIVVRAFDASGNVDAGFNGYVRISSKPGAIERIDSPDAEGRSLRLTDGVSPETTVSVTNAYGTTYILADDLGYAPVDALGDPPPACSNGIDDDGDGLIDFPADPGCAFANDDSETGGSYAQGASPPIFYHLPRVADVRGLKCTDPADTSTCSGSGKTPYPKEQILLDTGFHEKPDGSQEFDFDMVVTRISSDGFYVTDIKDERGGFNSVFSFNFNAPPRMRVCDRLRTFAGTATEFFGLTQISYPTWTLEEWDPQQRPCLVPEPRVLEPIDITSATLLPLSASLVRAVSSGDALSVMVTPKFGPGFVPEQGGVFVPQPDATNCDLNRDGRIDFTTGVPEQRCSDACTSDPECTEYSNFVARSTFRLTLTDANGTAAAIQADATASAEFKPLEMKGKPLKAFTGTLHFFSGGSQFTIEARCKDDIVVDLNATPLPSDKACVFPRTVLDENPQ